MKRILVATDGSEGAGRAVDFAAQLAMETGANLQVINVTDDHGLPEAVMGQFTRPQSAWIQDMLTAHSAELLRKARERARTKGDITIHLESRSGDVAQSVLEVAGETAADAVVVGKRGSGRVAGLLLGSVSQKLVSLATGVVIVVP